MADVSTHERSRQATRWPAKFGQDAMEKRVLMCSAPVRQMAGSLHELCSSSKHTKGWSHNELLTVVYAKISDEAVKEAY